MSISSASIIPEINTLIADITDSGQMFNAMTTHFGFGGL